MCQKKRKDVNYKLLSVFSMNSWLSKNSFSAYVCYAPDVLFWTVLYILLSCPVPMVFCIINSPQDHYFKGAWLPNSCSKSLAGHFILAQNNSFPFFEWRYRYFISFNGFLFGQSSAVHTFKEPLIKLKKNIFYVCQISFCHSKAYLIYLIPIN